MGFGKKRTYDVIDMPDLARKGFIKLPEVKKNNIRITKDGYVELSSASSPSALSGFESSNAVENINSNAMGANSDSAPSPFSFLDNLAGASTVASSGGSEVNMNNNENSNLSAFAGNDIGSIKVKIDDLEYKLDRLTEKLEMITSKLSEFESKVNR